MEKQFAKFRYIKENSLLFNIENDYELSVFEYSLIHKFYVTHSLVSSLTNMSISYVGYGWNSNAYEDGVKKEVCKIFDISNARIFQVASESNNIKQIFINLKLNNNENDYSFERVGICKSKGSNYFENLLVLVRNCLAHGCYRLKYCNGIKMVIMQDKKNNNVTGRAIVKLSTLLDIARIIDKNSLLQ